MRITGTVSNLELSNIKFTDLKGKENRCTESLQEFVENDEVIVVCKGIVKNNSVEVDESVYFVKQNVADQFLARFIDSLKQPENIAASPVIVGEDTNSPS
jgi:hypothetical protein